MSILFLDEALVLVQGARMSTGNGNLAARPEEQRVRAALVDADAQTAVRVLMTEYGDSLYGVIVQMMGDRSAADDVYQIMWIQVLRDRGQFSGEGSVRAWLHSIARHRCLDSIKMKRRRQTRFKPASETFDVADPALGAREQLASKELSSVLEQCLQTLPTETRIPVILRFQEGMSYKEIARICGERPGTLQARVVRALPILRKCVEDKT